MGQQDNTAPAPRFEVVPDRRPAAEVKFYRVRDFEKLQHYKNRNPPWVKLYRELILDYEFQQYDEVTRFHGIALLILASESGNKIPNDPRWVAGRIGAHAPVALDHLFRVGFLGAWSPRPQDSFQPGEQLELREEPEAAPAAEPAPADASNLASKMLADRASAETETETETETEFDAGAVDRKDYVKGFLRDVRKYRRLGVTAQVMLCFTSDPYHPGDNGLTRWTIQNLIEHGLAFCTLTKGGSRALRDMDLFRPDRDSFASSLTLLDETASAKWEAGAAPPADRIATLKKFYEAGIFTWVSLEPVIEPDQTLEIIRRTSGFVDLYKVGRMNYNSHGRKTDWPRFTEAAVEPSRGPAAGTTSRKTFSRTCRRATRT